VRARLALASVIAVQVFGCSRLSPPGVDAGPAQVGVKDTSAAKKPPALRAAKEATPALPDLPALTAHETPAPAPPPSVAAAGSDSSDHPCRAVWTGAQSATLACARSLLSGANAPSSATALLFGKDTGDGAAALVPSKLLSRSPDALPAVVDHRREGTEGPVRDQGSAPACTAFATSAAVDHAVARWSGKPNAVSVMEVWSRYHSPFVETSLLSNVGHPLGAEQGWPFSVSEATGWVPCDDFPKPPRTGCGRAVDDAHVQKLDAAPIAEMTEVEYLPAPPDTATLMSKIAAGQDVMIGMELPATFIPKGPAGARYVPHYTKSAGADAGHAVTLAGYARLPHGTYFLMHNSWGPSWGDGGYAWMHEATLNLWVHEAVVIDAEPLVPDPANRPRRKRGEVTCDAGLVPDSISGACAPPCPDGGPRHDDVCPVANQCPSSYVNLIGTCVLAAPTAKGSDPSTGIQWTCGPSGCSYVLPKAADPACTGGACMASCPAPDFRVGRMGQELVCLE
jgi:hypothetical protein